MRLTDADLTRLGQFAIAQGDVDAYGRTEALGRLFEEIIQSHEDDQP